MVDITKINVRGETRKLIPFFKKLSVFFLLFSNQKLRTQSKIRIHSKNEIYGLIKATRASSETVIASLPLMLPWWKRLFKQRNYITICRKPFYNFCHYSFKEDKKKAQYFICNNVNKYSTPLEDIITKYRFLLKMNGVMYVYWEEKTKEFKYLIEADEKNINMCRLSK